MTTRRSAFLVIANGGNSRAASYGLHRWRMALIFTGHNFQLFKLSTYKGNYRYLSYKKQQELLWELGEIEVGVGTLQATNRRVAEVVAPVVDLLWAWAPLQANRPLA